MKLKILTSLIVASAFSSYASALEVKLLDSAWNGIKVPEGQQCQKFGGNNPASPKLLITAIPEGSSNILLEYSDRDSAGMNNGGHGRMSYSISTTSKAAVIPSVPGHTFEMPDKFTMVEAHRGPGWDKAGAYMPPCSGGKDHAYYVTIKAMSGDDVTAETVLEIGKY